MDILIKGLPDSVVKTLDAKAKVEDRTRAACIRLALTAAAEKWARTHQEDLEAYCVRISGKD